MICILAPYYQFNCYYRFGRLDNCADKLRDLGRCIRIKFKRYDRASEELEQLYPGRGKPLLEHPVFEMRPPGQVPPMWQQNEEMEKEME
jgi:hypothetical protein